MIRAMQQRNLYPEVAQIVKAVWADPKDKDNAMRKAMLEAFPPRELVKRLVTAHYHEKACRYMGEFDLREDHALAQYVLGQLVKASQFDRAMSEATPDGGAGYVSLEAL